ncbi:MAG: hypothetical protein FD123_2587 [Bacteroidetes bacterium]|nr:MAG: hypothetical protein FD123_2587 [Bacteroidota bacterium]
MRAADAQYIPVVPVAQKRKPLVNDNIVHDKIAETVQSDSNADVKTKIMVHAAGYETVHARGGKNEEERIVLLEKSVFPLVMIAVQVPEQAVHNELMREPGHELHEEEGAGDDQDVDDDLHHDVNKKVQLLFMEISYG